MTGEAIIFAFYPEIPLAAGDVSRERVVCLEAICGTGRPHSPSCPALSKERHSPEDERGSRHTRGRCEGRVTRLKKEKKTV